MLKAYKNYSLLNYNTFGIDVSTSDFIKFDNEIELQQYLAENNSIENAFILGGGSNVLFTNNYKGVIIHPEIKGINIISETDDHAIIEVGAGEIWDDFVLWAVNSKLSGVENLSHIPGSVGATPVQNIGAYGVEVKDFIENVKTIDLKLNSERIFTKLECKFEYRNSIFKNELLNQVVITRVYFKLFKKHEYNLNYGNIKNEFSNSKEINLSNIRNAIIKIRSSKLPDPNIIGNAGSFFKNPVVSIDFANKLQEKYPIMPVYPTDGYTKLAAGWLIDKCGWKGKVYKNAGVHESQALVLINTGNATGSEIYHLSGKIKNSVFEKFGVRLEYEVIIK